MVQSAFLLARFLSISYFLFLFVLYSFHSLSCPPAPLLPSLSLTPSFSFFSLVILFVLLCKYSCSVIDPFGIPYLQ